MKDQIAFGASNVEFGGAKLYSYVSVTNKSLTIEYLNVSKEVIDAINTSRPVVALESTIISHGMPYPQNFETALKLEQTIRSNGATPATIAVKNGVMCVGLSRNEIEDLAQNGPQYKKLSRRDLPIAIARKDNGATTVASTMIIAEKAGIKVFATGGIGGVHRGVEDSMDVSADLEELAITDVAVVCSGVKSILDIQKTLEYLETKGVPVVGFKTDRLPAFYSRESEFGVDVRVDSAREAAEILKSKWNCGLKGGVIIANPIPEKYSIDYEQIDKLINQAIKEMSSQGIKGKHQTPFLLNKVKELTSGRSLESNIQLALNNAALAAQIAVEFFNQEG